MVTWWSFWFCCLFGTVVFMSGQIRSRRDFSLRFINSSEGDMPLVECGVRLYTNRKRRRLCSMIPLPIRFNPDLTVCTARSASPCVEGWYGAVVMWRIPESLQNSWNYVFTKHVVLSHTIVSGILCVLNNSRSLLIVLVDVHPKSHDQLSIWYVSQQWWITYFHSPVLHSQHEDATKDVL